MSARTLLVRHAEPERLDYVDGRADPELTEEGHRQARALADWLADDRLVAVYASPARRAVQTAQPLAAMHDLDITIDEGLVEFDWGSSQYIPFEQARAENHPVMGFWRALLEDRVASVPEIAEFRQRTFDVVTRLMGTNDDGAVAIVCHGGVINGYVSALLNAPKFMVTRTDYTGVTTIGPHSGLTKEPEWLVWTMNEIPHLRRLAEVR